jgi:hypothetical protein
MVRRVTNSEEQLSDIKMKMSETADEMKKLQQGVKPMLQVQQTEWRDAMTLDANKHDSKLRAMGASHAHELNKLQQELQDAMALDAKKIPALVKKLAPRTN